MKSTEYWYEQIIDYAECYDLSHLGALNILYHQSTEEEFTDEQFDELERMFVNE